MSRLRVPAERSLPCLRLANEGQTLIRRPLFASSVSRPRCVQYTQSTARQFSSTRFWLKDAPSTSSEADKDATASGSPDAAATQPTELESAQRDLINMKVRLCMLQWEEAEGRTNIFAASPTFATFRSVPGGMWTRRSNSPSHVSLVT